MHGAHPQLVRGKLEQLHPTQITVGKIEVACKREEWSKLGKKARKAALDSHWFPTILGPNGQHYIVDHHHFGLALIEEGVKEVPLLVLKDMSWLEPEIFWNMMEHNQWTHPYDERGTRRNFTAVPGNLTRLRDDCYRSLAGAVRSAGGYAKDVAPFSEFLWADYFRNHISARRIERDLAGTLAKAVELARSQDARYLPGWVGTFEAT